MRHQPTEHLLTEYKIPWEYLPEVRLTVIDRQASLNNQARNEPLDPDTVERFAVSMADPKWAADFPALVAYGDPGHKLVLIDGNHRLAAAHEAQRATADVYWVKTDDQFVRRRLTIIMNASTVSRPVPREELLMKAMDLIEGLGLTPADAAKDLRLKLGEVERFYRARQAHKKLSGFNSDIGYHQWPAATNLTIWTRLHALVDRLPVADAVAQLVFPAGLSVDQVNTLVTEVNKESGGEAAQLAVVQRWADEYTARQARGLRTTSTRLQPVEKIQRGLRTVRDAITEAQKESAVLPTPVFLDMLSKDWFDTKLALDGYIESASQTVVLV